MINVGIIGCGFVGGALKDWLEHNNPECKLFISDPPKGYNDDLGNIDIAIKGNRQNPHICGVFNFYDTRASLKQIPNMIIENSAAKIAFAKVAAGKK